MSDITISGMGTNDGLSQIKQSGKEKSTVFDELMNEAMQKLSQVQQDADKAVKELSAGGDVTQAIVSMEKADMNFQLMVQVRNKLISAYEDIIKMSV